MFSALFFMQACIGPSVKNDPSAYHPGMDDLAATLTLAWEAHDTDGDPRSVSLISVLEDVGLTLPPTPGATEPSVGRSVDGLPTQLGRHILLNEIGAGGMGRVLEARDPDLRRTVAIKVLARPHRVGREHLARFVAEAQTTSQLQHPNIVPLHDVGLTETGQVYFVMKKVEGRSLRQVIAALRAGEDREHFTLRRLLAMFVQICNAIAYAHDRGVLHRDIKPDNVMTGRFGEVLVMDWGVARLMGDDTEKVTPGKGVSRTTLVETLDGVAIGTPGYMSPEQASGDLANLDGRSDVWSLGAMLYELLTWERAFMGGNVFHLVLMASKSNPEDPRKRAPERTIPDELAEIALKALAKDPDARHQSALELGEAVEEFLEGSKRREAAGRHLVAAREAWERYQALAAEERELAAEARTLHAEIPRWAPLDDKLPLLLVRDRLRAIAPSRSTAYGDVLGECEKALSQDPGNPEARAFLADVFVQNFLDAQGTADEAHFAHRVRQYDDGGRHAALLQGDGTITVRTDPPAFVIAREVVRDGLVWRMGPPKPLGTTPLEDEPLGHGSWLLTLSAPGKRDTIYPVFLERCGSWDGGEAIPLYSDEEIGEDWVYVPAGPTILGGDELATDGWPRTVERVEGFFAHRDPVTNAEYCAFLNGLHADEAGAGEAHAPRKESYAGEGSVTRLGGIVQYWTPPSPGGRWEVPDVDDDGDAWDPGWPVFSIAWRDANAYCAWLSRETGGTVRLPREREWEKMSRGVDGRIFPWGDDFDPALCKMRHSREGRPLPEATGAFSTDVSVYGVRDCAGGMRHYCAEETFDGDPERRPVRGGSWRASDLPCRLCYRYGQPWWQMFTSIGFRVIRDLPSPEGATRRP